MSKKKIEAEICKAAGIKPNKGEDRQEFLTRAAKAIAKIENDDWEALSEESQLWHQAAVEAVKSKAAVPDFDEVEADEEEEEAPAKKSKSKPEKKSKKASKSDEEDESEEEEEDESEEEEEEAPAKKSKKASEPKKPAKRSQSSVSVLKQMFIKDPSLPIDKAMERLEKKGLSISKVTASTVRSDFRNTLRALDEAGLLKEGINF